MNILYGEDTVYALTFQQNSTICSYFVQNFSNFNLSMYVYRGAKFYASYLGMYGHSISIKYIFMPTTRPKVNILNNFISIFMSAFCKWLKNVFKSLLNFKFQ